MQAIIPQNNNADISTYLRLHGNRCP